MWLFSVNLESPAPAGYRYWRFSYNGTLSELQYDIGGTKYLFNSSNGCTLTYVSGVTQRTGELSDGILSTTNNQYIGATGGNVAVVQATFTSEKQFNKLWFYPQATSANGLIFNMPGYMTISVSSDDISWTNVATVNVSVSGNYGNTNLTAQGMTAGQMKQLAW